MSEKPPDRNIKQGEKNGELIEVDFNRKKIVSRSKYGEGEVLKPEDEQRIILDIVKYKIDFMRWLDGHILKMKYKYEEINALLTAGGYSRVLQYQNYLHLKNDPMGTYNDAKLNALDSFSQEDRILFGKIETQEMLFKAYLKEIFELKDVLETALKNAIKEIEEKKGSEHFVEKLQTNLDNLKLTYGELENLYEGQIIKKLEEFSAKNNN